MSLAYSEDPDEKLCNAKCCIYNAAFHQGLPCLLRQKMILRMQYFLDIITRDPSNSNYTCTLNHPRFTVSNQKKESIYEGLILCCMHEILLCRRRVGIVFII